MFSKKTKAPFKKRGFFCYTIPMHKILALNMKTYQTSVKNIEKVIKKIVALQTGSKALSIVCPPMPVVGLVGKLLPRKKTLALGAQDMVAEGAGAFTGTTSPELLKDLKAQYVIVGHSERRAMGETDADVNKKIRAALAVGLTPIVCVGEQTRDTRHQYLHTFKDQIIATFSGLKESDIQSCIVAYEPVWAIGKNAARSATADEAIEMALYITKILHEYCGVKDHQSVKIIYGGSVNGSNAEEFISNPHIDGLLVGRASIDVEQLPALFMAFK